MRRGMHLKIPTTLNSLWQMGGKVCDLPPDILDALAAQCRHSECAPAAVYDAQELMNARWAAEQAVAHAQR